MEEIKLAEGASHRIADPGKTPEGTTYLCGVCNAIMDERRKEMGPTSYAGAVSETQHLHDKWSCPFIEKMWHKRAQQCFQLAASTPSPTLAKIYRRDARSFIPESLLE